MNLRQSPTHVGNACASRWRKFGNCADAWRRFLSLALAIGEIKGNCTVIGASACVCVVVIFE